MKLIGVVAWARRDKNQVPIAGVVPLVDRQKGEWRVIDAKDEFPSQGQVFWYAAHSAVEHALVQFRAKPNPGQKDEFQVDAPELIWEVLDCRRFGGPADVRSALVAGSARIPGPLGSVRALVWCAPNVLVGPVELTRTLDSSLKLAGATYPRVALYSGATVRALSVSDREQRLVRVDEAVPSGYIDWDDDSTVLKRAIETAVKVARQARPDLPGQTKKQIDDAVGALASTGLGAEAALNRYRLERALALIHSTDVVTKAVGDLVPLLLEHPAVADALTAHKTRVAQSVEAQVRDALAHTLADKAKDLTALTESIATKSTELTQLEARLRDVDAAVDTAVQAAIERPASLLGQISVLRPLLDIPSGRAAGRRLVAGDAPLVWSRSGDTVADLVSLRRFLTTAARARGVDPTQMLRIHAAVTAGLMPIALGPGALAGLTAYADAVCGGRHLILHVPPTAVRPSDFDTGAGVGLSAASTAAQTIDGISMVILEGANRSPLEASLVPLLELTDLGLSLLASAPHLRLSASVVSGATTAPVTPQVWSHAVAVCPEAAVRTTQPVVLGTVPFSSSLFELGDAPSEEIDELIAAWPDSEHLRPTLVRFGSAMTRLYDRPRVKDELLNGVILPYVATALSSDEQADALGTAGDDGGATARVLRRLRRSLS